MKHLKTYETPRMKWHTMYCLYPVEISGIKEMIEYFKDRKVKFEIFESKVERFKGEPFVYFVFKDSPKNDVELFIKNRSLWLKHKYLISNVGNKIPIDEIDFFITALSYNL
jgi:hypothetical protein